MLLLKPHIQCSSPFLCGVSITVHPLWKVESPCCSRGSERGCNRLPAERRKNTEGLKPARQRWEWVLVLTTPGLPRCLLQLNTRSGFLMPVCPDKLYSCLWIKSGVGNTGHPSQGTNQESWRMFKNKEYSDTLTREGSWLFWDVLFKTLKCCLCSVGALLGGEETEKPVQKVLNWTSHHH